MRLISHLQDIGKLLWIQGLKLSCGDQWVLTVLILWQSTVSAVRHDSHYYT